MDNPGSTYRSDEQLQSMLDETGDWVVNDGRGAIKGDVTVSLREALRKATAFSSVGDTVRAISRLPPHDIIVFNAQIERLAGMAEG